MTHGQWPQRVLLAYEGDNFGGDFGESFRDGLVSHGCQVDFLRGCDPWQASYDLVLGYGPFTHDTGNLLPIAQRLLAMSQEQRPLLAWWLTEGIPDPRLPGTLVDTLARLRLLADRWLDRSPGRSRWVRLLRQGHRFRILGQLRWANAKGLLDVLAVTSAARAKYLRNRGFEPITVPLGYHPVYGSDLNLTRDIDVAFLGDTASPRRRQLLPRLVADLAARGIRVQVENFKYGQERTQFLNRTRIVLNVLRAPQDFVGQRFLLGAANKALIVTEPLYDTEPFVPGRHLVMAPLEKLPDMIAAYLADQAHRQQIVDAAFELVTKELTIKRMVGKILDQARQVRGGKR